MHHKFTRYNFLLVWMHNLYIWFVCCAIFVRYQFNAPSERARARVCVRVQANMLPPLTSYTSEAAKETRHSRLSKSPVYISYF